MSVQRAWHQIDYGPRRKRFWKYARRSFLLGTVVVGLAWLAFLLWRPFWHPNAYVAYWTGGRYEPPRLAPLDFAYEDFAQLVTLEPAMAELENERPLRLGMLTSSATFDQELGEFLRSVQRSQDAVILFVSAHVTTERGAPALRMSPAIIGQPAPEPVPLEGLVRRLSESPAATKLLILEYRDTADVGTPSTAFSGFPEAVDKELGKLRDSRLWVVLSHDWTERPATSWALKQTVFGNVAVRALQGAADTDENRAVDLGEFFEYVRVNVPRLTHHVYGPAATQTPLLLGTGTRPTPGDAPLLLAIGSVKEPAYRKSMSQLVATAQGPIEETGVLLEIRGHVQEHVDDIYEDFTLKLLGGQRYNPRLERARMVGQPLTDDVAVGPPSVEDLTEGGEEADESAPGAEAASGAESGQGAADEGTAAAEPTRPLTPEQQAERAAARRAEFERLRTEAWALRDQLMPSRGLPPFEYDPSGWRELDQTLLWYEQLQRAGAIGSDEWLYVPLRGLVASLRRLARGDVELRGRPRNVVERLIASRPVLPLNTADVHTLALAERLSAWQGRPLPKELTESIQGFDGAIASPDAQLLDTWYAASRAPEWGAFVEFELARRLKETNAPYPLTSLALRARRMAERVACGDALESGWLRHRFQEVEGRLSYVEESLVERISADWAARAEADLSGILIELAELEEDATFIRDAWRLRSLVLREIGELIDVWSAVGDERAPVGFRAEDLHRYVDQLQKVCLSLDTPSPDEISELRSLWRGFLSTRSRLLNALGLAAGEWTDPEWNRENLGLLRALCETTLPLGSVRENLLLRTIAAEVSNTSSFEFVPLDETDSGEPPLDPARRKRLNQIISLRLASLRLAVTGNEDWAAGLDQLESRAKQLLDLSANEASDHSSEFRATWVELARELDAYRAGIDRQVRSVLTDSGSTPAGDDRSKFISWLRTADRATRVLALPANDSELAIGTLLAYTRWYDGLQFQRDRAIAAHGQDSVAGWIAVASLDRYREAAHELPRQPRMDGDRRSPLSVDGTNEIFLDSEGTGRANIDWSWLGDQEVPAWVVVEYDETKLSLRAADGTTIYSANNLPGGIPADSRAADANSSSRITSMSESLGTASLRLAPRGDRSLALELTAASTDWERAKINVWLIAETAAVKYPVTVWSRGRDAVRLVVSSEGEWTSGPDGVSLHPLPNRKSAFRLQVATDLADERQVRAQLYATALPLPTNVAATPFTTSQAQDFLDPLRPLTPVGPPATVTVRAHEPRPLLFTPPVPAEGGAAGPPPNGEPVEFAPVPLRNGMLVGLTDVASGKEYFRVIRFIPRRPRGYVRCQVGYNLAKERLEIEVRPLAAEVVPKDGIKVACEFVEPLPFPGESRLEATIEPPEYVARMFAAIPARAAHIATVLIHVDDYPRAFIYRAPCQTASTDLPELHDVAELRILAPVPDAAFLPSAEGLSVEMQVDAPVGTFQREPSTDYVEVGLDIDRDRELLDEPTVKLLSDRQVDVVITDMSPDGTITFEPKVKDFSIKIPTAGVNDVRANVLARLQASGRATWSRPVEVILGGSGPAVERVELTPGRNVVIGSEAEVSAWIVDRHLAKLAKVEAAWDLDRDGKLTDADQPEVAQVVAGVRWSAKLKTDTLKEGTQLLLVRATDALGTEGPVRSEEVVAFTPGQIAAQTNVVSGVVQYGKWNVANARVALERQGEVIVGPTFTDDEGRFEFPQVPIGDYDLTARGLSKNRPRTASRPITVKPLPAKGIAMEVQVR